MSYLKHKKRKQRINITLGVLFTVLLFAFLLSFARTDTAFVFSLESYRLQILGLSFSLMVYSLYINHRYYLVLYSVLSVLAFFGINHSVNIFSNISNTSFNEMSLVYVNNITDFETAFDRFKYRKVDFMGLNGSNHIDLDSSAKSVTNIIFTTHQVLKEGLVRLSPEVSAYYLIPKSSQKVVLINVDFSHLEYSDAPLVFNNLSHFVSMQDYPVIVFGDFKLAAWSRIFTDFLDNTRLAVKNHLIMSDGGLKFNPFVVPSVYVLGYDNIGVNDVKVLKRSINSQRPFLFEINL